MRVPEMVKRRAVVVISPRQRSGPRLAIVVPLSTSQPERVMPYHHLLQLSPEQQMPRPFEGREKWVKGDMLYTMSFDRLSRPCAGKDPDTGRRIYPSLMLTEVQMECVEKSVLAAIGILR
jgi:uncharacterized protein YifN (PemK superfamily)